MFRNCQDCRHQFTCSVVVPGCTMEICPPHMHWHFESAVNAGMPPIIVFDAPGVHGATVFGRHGVGVSTPRAAAVAAAVVGFASDEHTPKGRMFTNGLWSMIFAAGFFSIITRDAGRTIRVPGAAPNEH